MHYYLGNIVIISYLILHISYVAKDVDNPLLKPYWCSESILCCSI